MKHFLKTILFAALLCANAQPSGTDTKQLTLLRAKAEKGDAPAQCDLADAYLHGHFGLPTNEVEAVKWLRKAAEQNYAEAQSDLGLCYAKGQGVEKDEREAMKWFRKAAEQNHAQAQLNLGLCYYKGEGVAKDEVEAAKWFHQAAEQNNAVAQYNLGTCYFNGLGVATNYASAIKWYRKAAGQNYAAAQFNLGVCYAAGQGVDKDEVEAVKWYRKAAEQNLAEAQYNLSLCYARDESVAKDFVEAYKWLLLAAAQGYEPAEKFMTILERRLKREQLAEGQKLASDFKPPEVPSPYAPQGEAGSKPLAELRAKAETGDAKAQNELGETFLTGKLGARKDAVSAVKWFRKAAAQNFAAAQSNLGVRYEYGEGVTKYEAEAYMWYLLAAAQGDNKAKRNRFDLELMLSPEQIEEGKRRADDWLEQRKNPATNNR